MVYGTPAQFMLGQCLMAVPLGMALGLQGAMVVEIFPLRTRVTSMSFAYSVTLALAGEPRRWCRPGSSSGSDNRSCRPGTSCSTALIGLAMMWPMSETNARRLDQ